MKKQFSVFCYLGSIFISIFFISSCATEFNLATQKEERLLYDTEKEVEIGFKASLSIEKRYKMIEDVDVNERLNLILDKIAAASDRTDVVYFIKAIDEDPINAVSLPGGYVYVFRGLLDEVESDDQLAGVIAHEVAHITAKHGIKRLQAAYGAVALQVASAVGAGGDVARGVNLALGALFSEYSQMAEFEADELGVKYMKKAGYNPEGMREFMETLEDENKKTIRSFSYFKTHPYPKKRIAVINKAISGEMSFRDFVILTETEY